MRTRPPRPRKTYDRHWAYPNPAGPVRRLLGDSKAGRDLCRRIAGGDPREQRGRVVVELRLHAISGRLPHGATAQAA